MDEGENTNASLENEKVNKNATREAERVSCRQSRKRFSSEDDKFIRVLKKKNYSRM